MIQDDQLIIYLTFTEKVSIIWEIISNLLSILSILGRRSASFYIPISVSGGGRKFPIVKLDMLTWQDPHPCTSSHRVTVNVEISTF